MDSSKHLQCAEIWGGNRFVEAELALPGMDAWIYCQPCDSESGGDVHYLSSCASGQFARILLADVAGHGQAVGQTAEQLRKLMQRYVIYHSQTELTRAINRHFARFARDGQFATALVATFNAGDNRFSLTNAGHPPPFHYEAAGGRWSILRRRPSHEPGLADVPLGVERDTLYGQLDLSLAVGDLVLWYTDALMEAKTAEGRLLGPEGLLDELQKVDLGDPVGVIPRLLARIRDLRADNLTGDDVTALLFRANGRHDFVSLSNLVMAPYRHAMAMIRANAD